MDLPHGNAIRNDLEEGTLNELRWHSHERLQQPGFCLNTAEVEEDSELVGQDGGLLPNAGDAGKAGDGTKGGRGELFPRPLLLLLLFIGGFGVVGFSTCAVRILFKTISNLHLRAIND